MGIFKKIVGGAKVVGGVLTGQPALVVSGGADIATDFAKKKPSSGGVVQPGRTNIPISPMPPMRTFPSVEARRANTQSRVKNKYKFPG